MSWIFGTAGVAPSVPVEADTHAAETSDWFAGVSTGFTFGAGALVDRPSLNTFGTQQHNLPAAEVPFTFLASQSSSLFDAPSAACASAAAAPVDFTPRCRSEIPPPSGLPPPLPMDTFFSVCQFLNIGDLARMHQLCSKHSWGAMVRSMPRVLCAFHLHSEVFPFVSLIAEVIGPLARHVGDLRMSVLLAPADVGVLTDRFPHLRSLDITVHVRALMNSQPHPTTPWRFPSGLRSLTLRSILDGGRFSAGSSAKAFPVYGLDALKNLETLDLQVPGVDLKALLSCPRLTHLTLPWSDDPARTEVLCALSSLRRLLFTRCPPSQFGRGLSETAVLRLTNASRRWEEISFDEYVRWSQTMFDVACLCPGLLKLAPESLHCDNVQALARVPLLRELRLVFGQLMTDSDAIVRRIATCSHLTALTLGGPCTLSSADLCLLLPSLPHLASLELRLAQLGSLEFCNFAAPTLSRSLVKLLIEYPLGFFATGPAVVAPLAGLRHLQDLEFACAQVGKRDNVPDAIMQLLRPPSMLVPSLRMFSYPAVSTHFTQLYQYRP